MATVRDEIQAKLREDKRRRARVAEMFEESGIVAIDVGGREEFLVLHPSTRRPGAWQVSAFGFDGPIGHDEGGTREEAIKRALETHGRKAKVRPASEAEFMELSQSDEFIEGSKRVRFVQLVNELSFEYGRAPAVRELEDKAHAADTMDEAIEILERGARRLRKGKG